QDQYYNYLNQRESESYAENIIPHREENENNAIIGQRGEINQARTIFFGILDILVSILFLRKKRKNDKISELYKEVYLYLIILFAISSMLFLDTHLQDLQARSVWGKDSTVKSINKIASDSTMYTTFYNL